MPNPTPPSRQSTSAAAERRDDAGRARTRAEAAAEQLLQRAIARVREGDVAALHYVYVRFADDVRGYVQSIVRSPDDAEDVTQNVFAKLPTAIRRYERREVPFAAWILRVARNAALDHVRSRRLLPREEIWTSDDGYEHDDLERCQSLRAALGALPPDQREVLVLRHIAGLSPGEIATRMDKTESAVHGLHHRGRTALRELDSAPITHAAA